MLDHVTVNVSDFQASRRFYAAALEPLGYAVAYEWETGCGLGTGQGNPQMWIRQEGEPGGPVHFAFVASSQEAVQAFHEAALAAGGTDNGPPGIREQYSPTYYAAFAHDPDGNNVEAVHMG